jgi:hypothetical protein
MPADSRSDYLEQLAAIREDPQVKNLARVWAQDPDLAEDALQEAFYTMARLKHPERVKDPGKHFCLVVVRKACWLRGQLGAALVDDFAGRGGALPPSSPLTTATSLAIPGGVQ